MLALQAQRALRALRAQRAQFDGTLAAPTDSGDNLSVDPDPLDVQHESWPCWSEDPLVKQLQTSSTEEMGYHTPNYADESDDEPDYEPDDDQERPGDYFCETERYGSCCTKQTSSGRTKQTSSGRTSAYSNKSTKRAEETSIQRGLRKDAAQATTKRGKSRVMKMESNGEFGKLDEREPPADPDPDPDPKPLAEPEDGYDSDELTRLDYEYQDLGLTYPALDFGFTLESLVRMSECKEQEVPAAKAQVPAAEAEPEVEDDDYDDDECECDYDDQYDSFHSDRGCRISRSGSSYQGPYTAKHVRAVTGKMELHTERKDLSRTTSQARSQARTGKRVNKSV